MTDYVGFLIPLPDLFQQVLTGSLDDGLERFTGYVLDDLEASGQPLLGMLAHIGSLAHHTFTHSGFRIPSYADDLFGHIVIEPERLDLGNLLSQQTRTIEIGNLNFEPVDWSDLVNNAGAGITFNNLPSFPHEILPFGSFVLSVSISTEGPATIDGTLDFEFPTEVVVVPITGSRIVMFHWIPQANATEVLEWATDPLEAYDGTEQRIRIRLAPRQRISYTVIVDGLAATELRAVLFDWLPRVFGVPIWWEKRDLTNSAAQGSSVLEVPTAYGDFRVGDLVMVYANADDWEALQVQSFDGVSITTESNLIRSYPAGAFVMPVRPAYMQTLTTHNKITDGTRIPLERVGVDFTTVENADLSDQTGASFYDGRVVLDDGNVIADGDLPETFERPVIVIDNRSGRILQNSRVDRSRIKSVKTWDAPTPAELWRVRQLLHSFHGSQKSFWVPTCRLDLVLTDPIGPGTTELRIELCGYTAFIQSRRPLADIRIVKTDGTVIHKRVIDSVVDEDEEVLTTSTIISGTAIAVEAVERIELLALMRIDDDMATIEHRKVGDATIRINLISIKE